MSERLRNMTSIYITREDRMLLLYRIGFRVVTPSWCGIGGHFEEAELNNPEPRRKTESHSFPWKMSNKCNDEGAGHSQIK